MQPLPPIDVHSLLTQWDISIVWSVAAVVLLVGYRVAMLRGTTQGFPAWRVATYVVGVVVLWLSVSSAVQVYSETVFYMHMVQHLLLITVVPALLVLGQPLTVLDAATGGRVRAVLHTPAMAVLTHPVVGLVVYGVVIVGTHLTGFMDEMMTSAWLAPGEKLLYLGAGYLYLLPLLGEQPLRWQPARLMRVALLVLGMIPDTVVGIVLLQSNVNPFPAMLSTQHTWAPNPLTDAQTGGGLMWALGDGLMMVLAVGSSLAMVLTRDGSSPVGPWLEGVRQSTLQHHTSVDGTAGFADDVDVDEDTAALDAYNAMLRRMGGRTDA